MDPRLKRGRVWWITTTYFLAIALVSLESAAQDGFFMSNTADRPVEADGLGSFIAMPSRLPFSVTDSGSFLIICRI